MASAKVRLILASVLFAGWLGYLGWLAWANARPQVQFKPSLQISKTRYEVLSRSQFLLADLDVSVHVDDDGNITDDAQILWARDGRTDVDIWPLNIKKELEACDLQGRGPFLVPLVRNGAAFVVVAVPDMPEDRDIHVLPFKKFR